MSTVFFAPRGQPMLQRARLVQPPWATPENGWARSSPKWTASGSRSASVPPRRPSSSNAPSLRSGGSSGVVRGSSASSVRSYQGSSSLRSIASGQPLSNTSRGARSCTLA